MYFHVYHKKTCLESGFILKPVAKVRSRSKSFEPFISGPMELVIPDDVPNDSKKWRRCDYKGSRSPARRRSPSPFRKRRSPSSFVRRRSPSPFKRRRSKSPNRKNFRASRSPIRGRRHRRSYSISPLRRKKRSPSPGVINKSPIRGNSSNFVFNLLF